jgi:hypothetical protein
VLGIWRKGVGRYDPASFTQRIRDVEHGVGTLST